jgi:outer membrane lipoprotein-sorting protein
MRLSEPSIPRKNKVRRLRFARRRGAVAGLLIWAILGTAAAANTAAERLIAAYDSVASASCEIVRDSVTDSGRLRTLSRVDVLRPGRIHVETVAPVRRRIVADGTNLYFYQQGEAAGLKRPVAELDEAWRIQLQRLPGTALDHLYRLRGATERALPATDRFPRRIGYALAALQVALAFDPSNRLTRIEYYRDAAMSQRTAVYTYSQFEQRGAGLWFARHLSIEREGGGKRVTEELQIHNLEINAAIPAERFAAERYFRGVRFADTMPETADRPFEP